MSGQRGAVTLSQLLARNIRVEPCEAIAIVRSVIALLPESGPDYSIPELHQIQVGPEGTITVTGGLKAEQPVRRLGQMLQALLTQSAPPVQLRLVISRATAPESPYASITEYSDALAYFERPDRAADIRALYVRASESSASIPAAVPTIDGMAPLTPADNVGANGRLSAKRRRPASRLLAAGGLVALICFAAVLSVRYGLTGRNAGRISKVVAKASDAVGSAFLSGASALTDRAGLGRLVAAGQAGPAGAAVTTAGSPARREPARPLRRTKKSIREVSVVAFDLESLPVLEDAGPSGAVPLPLLRRPPANVALTAALDSRIYNPGSEGVSPPVSVRPQLRRELPATIAIDDLGRIELIVLEDGKVGSVKLLGSGHTISDAMMLSAAKTWEFRPALKDGHPVKYRKILWMVRP
jgi:hypothetical protein